MFEKASRLKLRIPTSMGILSIEDLWDLPLVSSRNTATLDNIAKSLSKTTSEESFVTEQSTASKNEILVFDIVKHIIKVRLEEVKIGQKRIADAAKKQRILKALENLEQSELDGSSKEKLLADLAEL